MPSPTPTWYTDVVADAWSCRCLCRSIRLPASAAAPSPSLPRAPPGRAGDPNEWLDMYESVWYIAVVRGFVPAVFLALAGKAVHGMWRWRKSRAQNATVSSIPFFVFFVMFLGGVVQAAITAAGGWFGSSTLPFEPERILFLLPTSLAVLNNVLVGAVFFDMLHRSENLSFASSTSIFVKPQLRIFVLALSLVILGLDIFTAYLQVRTAPLSFLVCQ